MLILKMISFLALVTFVVILGFVLIYWIPKKIQDKEKAEARRKYEEEIPESIPEKET